MPRFVLDNSLTMAWYFEDEATPFADSSYDASYLDLAQREGLPLASLDNRLRDAARRVGVVLLDET